ncbi:hypothetical protein SHJG_p262 (plasmid) [Streptomyces hygroscopicus subsp. jinggangensis 5008]|nr:hypothetical protein SHJG_p262 [Streptomyces hygroscopicus subsp. jinggangensis 5008]AGF68531.1 hypothetical protein SHJGH_p262 [Streptomyces hygroscopicus subsp. jinggangensis TL01]
MNDVVQVREYERADGTNVRAHSRWHPGARRELTIFAVIALAVVGFGSSGGSADGAGAGERLPRPQRTGVYPVHFPGWDKPAPRPTPTVSYPIHFPGWDKPAPRPTPTVSYPIPWDRSQ